MFVDIPVSFEGYDNYCGVGSVSMVMWYFEQEFLSKQVAPLIILRYLVPGDISKRMCRGKGVQKTFGAMNHCMLTYTCQYNREWENLTQSYFRELKKKTKRNERKQKRKTNRCSLQIDQEWLKRE